MHPKREDHFTCMHLHDNKFTSYLSSDDKICRVQSLYWEGIAHPSIVVLFTVKIVYSKYMPLRLQKGRICTYGRQ